MDLKGALRELEAKGKLSARKAAARHGMTGSCFGVSASDLASIAKELKTDHALAVQLWGSGNHDARVLATLIADPALLDDTTLLAWLDDADNYVITDALAIVIAKMSTGLALARRLIDQPGEWPATAGWTALARLIAVDESHDPLAAQLLARVERTVQEMPNRTRHAMNTFVIAAGGRDSLRERALDTARKMGAVAVEHGDSGGKTPDATVAIAKAAAHEKSQAKKSASAAAKKRR
jgi:3-methyladenine DNA glycosylase AlkD